MDKNKFLKAITVKTKVIKLETLDNEEIEIKEPSINESLALEEIRKEVLIGNKTEFDLIIESCKCVCGDHFFSDVDLKNLSQSGISVLMEIYMKIPTIGMTKEQEESYEKSLIESKNKQAIKALTKEEEEKK